MPQDAPRLDAPRLDSPRLSRPTVYGLRMAVFLALVGLVAAVLYRGIEAAFDANPGLNGLIIGVLGVGVLMAIASLVRLDRAVVWARSDPQRALSRNPGALAPLGPFIHGGMPGPVPPTVLEAVSGRLDDGRETLRYLAGLLVFLGLLGTFWGLIATVGSVGQVIANLRTGAESGTLFDDLKGGLAAPLAGMGISFSSSLFGLAGSLVIGFLDLQIGRAHARLREELEDGLDVGLPSPAGAIDTDLRAAIERLTDAVAAGPSSRQTTAALANLAEGIQTLVQHMRSEQQMIRDWVEGQAGRDREFRRLLDRVASDGGEGRGEGRGEVRPYRSRPADAPRPPEPPRGDADALRWADGPAEPRIPADAKREPPREPAREAGRDASRDPARDPSRDPSRDPARDPARDPSRDRALEPASERLADRVARGLAGSATELTR